MKRPIRIEIDVAYVPLTKGQEAMIDLADVDLVDGVNWYALNSPHRDGRQRSVYAVRMDGRKMIYMHRLIARAPDGLLVDHIDGDGLNNRRHNVRVATAGQNNQNKKIKCNNTTGVKGVIRDNTRGKFRAEIRVDKKAYTLGRFDKLEDAADAYARASAVLHGEFGRLE